MSPFGFTPDDGDEENGKPEDLNAMMRQMQEQIQKQFEQLGINPAGFVNPFASFAQGSQDALPQAVVRDTAKKFVQAQGSQPLGTKDVTVVDNAFEIADLWLNEATVFPATSGTSSQRSVSRLDWVDETLAGWQATMEPLATGLSSAISSLLDDAMAQQSQDVDSGEAMAGPMGAIAGLLRTFIGSLIATQLGQAIGGISATATGAVVAPKITQDEVLPTQAAPLKLVIAVSHTTILKNMKLTVPKGGVAKFSIAKSSAKVCKVMKKQVLGTAIGTCRVSVTIKTTSKKSVTKSMAFKVSG